MVSDWRILIIKARQNILGYGYLQTENDGGKLLKRIKYFVDTCSILERRLCLLNTYVLGVKQGFGQIVLRLTRFLSMARND